MLKYSGQHWALLPFVMGIIAGVTVSTVILVRPYTEQVVTNNVYILDTELSAGEAAGHSQELEDRLLKFERIMEELHPAEHRGAGPRLLADEAKLKDPVHYSVIMSDPSSDMVDILKNTWARNIAQPNIDYFFPPKTHTSPDAEDARLSSAGVVHLSTEGPHEIQVLQHVCKNQLNSTKWFFFGYDTAYVKTDELESYLLTLEAAQSHLPYMGKPVKREPEELGRLCLPGPGSLLSSLALSQLCPRVGSCMVAEFVTDCVLGECVRKILPDVECSKGISHPQAFLKFDGRKSPIIDPKNKATLHRALTIYPVADTKLMYNIHQLVVSRRLSQSQFFAQELKQMVDQMASFLPHSRNTYGHSNGEEAVTSREGISAWQLINHNRLMDMDSDNPARKVPEFWRVELDALTTRIMEYLSSLQDDQQLVFSRVVNAYFRLHPVLGMQYIVDFEAKSVATQGDQTSPPLCFSSHLSRSYNPPEVSPIQPQVKHSKRVTVAMVMIGEQEEELQVFMKRLDKVLSRDQRLDLVVVKMRTEKDRAAKKASDSSLESLLHSYETRYLRASFKLVSSPYLLSRAHGLALVLHEVKPTDILFLSDLYLAFDASFLERCRNIPLQGQQVYYPIPFAVDTGNRSRDSPGLVSRSTGHWLVKSHGVSCVYAADVLSSTPAGGKGIPKEVSTEELYQALLEKEYEVVRSVDSGLWRWTPKNSACDLELVGEEQESCRTLQDYPFERLSTQLSQMLFNHEGKHSDKKF